MAGVGSLHLAKDNCWGIDMAPVNKQETPGFIALVSNTQRLTEAGQYADPFQSQGKKTQPHIFGKYYNSQ